MTNTTATFEKETCSRCAGSGSYSWNAMNGSRCFKCYGTGIVLTKRGATAKAHYMSLLEKQVSEIKVGDSVLANIGMSSTKKWFKVESMEPDTLNEGRIRLQLTRPSKTYDHGYTLHNTSKLHSVRTEAERLEKIEQAYEYQATLTKTGKPAKKLATAA
jgi:hypothetical protein